MNFKNNTRQVDQPLVKQKMFTKKGKEGFENDSQIIITSLQLYI